MTSDIDLWRAAKLLVDRYGEGACVEAAMRADDMLDQGDREGRAVWLRILEAIRELYCHPKIRRRMGRQARAFAAENCASGRQASKTLDVLRVFYAKAHRSLEL